METINQDENVDAGSTQSQVPFDEEVPTEGMTSPDPMSFEADEADPGAQSNSGANGEPAAEAIEKSPEVVAESAVPSNETRPELQSGATLALGDSVGPVPIRAGWDAEAVAVEWLRPGLADILVSAEGGPKGRSARVFRHIKPENDQPLRYEEGVDVEGLDSLRCLCPIPNGGESRFDLVALASEGLIHLPNTGTVDTPRFSERRPLDVPANLGIGHGRVAQIVAEDWDGDGQVDLIIGFDDLEGYWPAQDLTVPQSQRVGFNQRGGHPGYSARGQWRGLAPRGRLFWMRNAGTPGAPRFESPVELTSESSKLEVGLHPAPLVMAWGGGHGVEFLLTDAKGTVRVHRNFGGQRPPVLMEPRPIKVGSKPLMLPEDRTSVLAVDLDGDHSAELLFGTADGRVFAVHAGRGRDEAIAPVPLLCNDHTLRFGGHAVISVGDLDNDGDLDIVAGDGPGRLFLAADLGDHRYRAPVELDALGLPFRLDPGPDGMLEGPAGTRLGFACPTICDWDGNGKPDLIVGGAGGDVLFFHNNGSSAQPRFERPIPLKCGEAPLITPPRVRPAVAFWDEGDEVDLIALDLQGFLCVYPRTGPYEVGEPRPLVDRLGRLIRLDGGFGQAGHCALWAGPWTGPDCIDLLVGLPLGNRHVIPAITGQPLGTPDELPTVLLLERVDHDVVIPRPVYLADGRPLIVGTEGCSPCGVSWSDPKALDLIVGSDDGRVFAYRRNDLITV